MALGKKIPYCCCFFAAIGFYCTFNVACVELKQTLAAGEEMKGKESHTQTGISPKKRCIFCGGQDTKRAELLTQSQIKKTKSNQHKQARNRTTKKTREVKNKKGKLKEEGEDEGEGQRKSEEKTKEKGGKERERKVRTHKCT